MTSELAVWRPARNQVYQFDALQFLWQLPSESVSCCITSPPYYGLRSYLDDDHADKPTELGLEETPQAYIERMVAVFREVRRVLRSDGVAFVNMGDSYVGSTSQHKGAQTQGYNSVIAAGTYASVPVNGRKERVKAQIASGFKPKDLMMMPARLAIALQADGWYVRSDIVWHKPNPMPESVTDRPTSAHEYVFMLTKSAKYWADMDAVREAVQPASIGRYKSGWNGNKKRDHPGDNHNNFDRFFGSDSAMQAAARGRNLRSVWTIATQPTPFAHFATFPQALVERCIKMGAPAKTCAECGAGWERVVEREYLSPSVLTGTEDGRFTKGRNRNVTRMGDGVKVTTKGFRPSCECGSDDTRPGLVLDIFMGSGTTGLVARRLGRDYIGCDLSAEYVALARKRLRDSDPFQASEVAGVGQQLSLFGGVVEDNRKAPTSSHTVRQAAAG